MPEHFGILMLPGMSLYGLAGAVEVFRRLRLVRAELAPEWLLLSRDGAPVRCLGGERIAADAGLAVRGDWNGLFLAAEHEPGADDQPWIDAVLAPLGRRIERSRGVLGGFAAGGLWWGRCGLMDGYRMSTSEATQEWSQRHCPAVSVTRSHYVLDRNRWTCASPRAGIEMLIEGFGGRFGELVQSQLRAHFNLERPASVDEPSRAIDAERGMGNAKLAEAVALMQANLGEPLSTEDIAGLVGVSRRQLERLFKQHLDTLPSRWYLEQRLQRARRLLLQSSESILQIGLGCGFASGAHFSNAYRGFFGRTPRDERGARAAAWRSERAPQEGADAIPLTPESSKERS